MALPLTLAVLLLQIALCQFEFGGEVVIDLRQYFLALTASYFTETSLELVSRLPNLSEEFEKFINRLAESIFRCHAQKIKKKQHDCYINEENK